MDLLGWLGNIGIIGGIYGLGNKWRNAFLASVVGESCYIVRGVLNTDWALVALCSILGGLAIRGYVNWGQSPAVGGGN